MAKNTMTVEPRKGGSYIIGGPETLETKVKDTPELETKKQNKKTSSKKAGGK